MKTEYRIFLLSSVFILFVIGLFGISTAEFIPGEDYLVLEKNVYAPNELISGSINISLIDEGSDSLFRTNLWKQNISILDFLLASGLTAARDFFCNPESCEDLYEIVGSSALSKDIIAGNQLIGGMITARDVELQSDALEFSITGKSTATKEYCGTSPIEIDLLADGSIDWRYTKTSGKFCGALLPSHCYDNEVADKSFDITQNGYCEKVSLPVSGRFKLTALVKKNKGGGDLIMFIYDQGKNNRFECDLEEPNVTTSFVEKSCVVNFSVLDSSSQQDYYICIIDELEEDAYSIKGEMVEPMCGYAGLPYQSGNASADFAFLVQPTSISAFNKSVRIDETKFSKSHTTSMHEYLVDYIKEKYSNDCPTGCMLPVSINSQEDVTLSDFSLRYCGQGLCETEDRFFTIKKKSALLNMNFTKLSLEKLNFSVPSYGDYTFELWLGDELIGSEKINVEKVPAIENLVAISPEAGVPIPLFVEVYSPKNNLLVKFEWDFGDGNSQTTTEKEVMHTYTEVGWFDVKITVTDAEGLIGSRTFTLKIGSPKKILNATLKKKKVFLENISAEVEVMSWYKDLAAGNLDLYELEEQVTKYEEEFKLAISDEEYVSIMKKVKDLVVPKKTYDAELIQESPLIVDVNDIRPEYLEQLGAGTYEPEYAAETRNAIWDWQWKNLDVRASGRVVDVVYDDGSVGDLVTVLTFNLKPKKEAALEEVYFVLLEPYSKMSFASDYGQQNIIDSAGFVFQDLSEKALSIALAGKVEIHELVFFSSPRLYELDMTAEAITCNINNRCEPELGENWRNCREDCKPIGLALVYFILVILVMVAVYLFLQRWYKKNYERYLFKNPQDLYNIRAFTANSLKKGLREKGIQNKLKKAGWSGEQISYVLKKMKVKPKPAVKPSGLGKFKKQ